MYILLLILIHRERMLHFDGLKNFLEKMKENKRMPDDIRNLARKIYWKVFSNNSPNTSPLIKQQISSETSRYSNENRNTIVNVNTFSPERLNTVTTAKYSKYPSSPKKSTSKSSNSSFMQRQMSNIA